MTLSLLYLYVPYLFILALLTAPALHYAEIRRASKKLPRNREGARELFWVTWRYVHALLVLGIVGYLAEKFGLIASNQAFAFSFFLGFSGVLLVAAKVDLALGKER